MDVISGRKTGGTITGEILVNGQKKDDHAFRRVTGYVEQMDIHDPFTTVKEGLLFSARLRLLVQLPEAKLHDTVNRMIELLELTDVANTLVGSLSVGEMKRYTIGVELVTNPSVLFLDEPTSGLDSRSARIVMDVVAKIARSGRTVVATIHQPSSEIFFRFDQLLLLKRGGNVVFFGSVLNRGRPLVEYLTTVSRLRIPRRTNPANWMLNVIDNKYTAAAPIDFVHAYAASAMKRSNDDLLQQAITTTTAPAMVVNEARASSWTRFSEVFKRTLLDYWRNPIYNFVRILVNAFLGFLFGVIFFKVRGVGVRWVCVVTPSLAQACGSHSRWG